MENNCLSHCPSCKWNKFLFNPTDAAMVLHDENQGSIISISVD